MVSREPSRKNMLENPGKVYRLSIEISIPVTREANLTRARQMTYSWGDLKGRAGCVSR